VFDFAVPIFVIVCSTTGMARLKVTTRQILSVCVSSQKINLTENMKCEDIKHLECVVKSTTKKRQNNF